MFEELMPLLAQRVLVVTLSRVGTEKICVNVIPKPLKSDQQDDGAALTTPLSVTGTPKELDEQLPTTTGGVCGGSPGAVLNLEECERTDGGCRQSSKGSSQETDELEIAQRVQQECGSKLDASADRGRRERKLRRFTVESRANPGNDRRR